MFKLNFGLCAGFKTFAGLFNVIPVLLVASSVAHAADPLDGTWGGANGNRQSAQIIIAGHELIGFYWRGDYLDTSHSRFSAGGARLSFTFKDGAATLKRTVSGARLMIMETGQKKFEINLTNH